MDDARRDYRTGLVHAAGAYLIWGVLPLFLGAIHAPALEIVANRILWSLILLLAILAWRRELGEMAAVFRDRRRLAALGASTVLIAANWIIFILAVEHRQVVAASLGYFLNPLMNVLLGVTVLKERLGRWQWLAIGFAGAGVAVLAASAPTMLGISVTLAASFALYGLVRKLVPVSSLTGLAVETALLAPVALVTLAVIGASGGLAFGGDTATTSLLLASGVVTSAPLLLFASGARRLPLVTLGLVQYVAPTMQFLTGVLLLDERLDPARWASVGLIWAGIAIFVADVLLRRRSPGASG